MITIPQLRLLTEKIRTFERSGRYREAFEALGEYWNDFHAAPDTTGFPETEKAQLHLRCGVLAGFLGRMENSTTAQENSKDLLTVARELFQEIGDEAHLVEAENGIALAYVRKGEFREAETWIESSFSHDLSPDHFARIQSFLVKSLLLLEMKRYEDAHRFLIGVESFFREFDDDYLNGCYSANLGMVHKKLGRLPEAMQMYTVARHFQQRAENKVHLAIIDNNLANLYLSEKRFGLAHQAIDSAIELHNEAGDLSRRGFALDTKAIIFLEEGKLTEAENCADQGIEILRDTEFAEFLIDTLFSKIKIQIARDNLAGAAITFSEVAEIVRRVQGSDSVEQKADEFEKLVSGSLYCGLGRILTEKVIPGEDLELELAPSLSGFTEFDAIWIKNAHFAKLGLEMGCLALVVAEDVMEGDLVAVTENGSEEAICGYLSRESGNIIISIDESESEILREDSAEVIGRIVGYANPDSRVAGRLRVEPLKSDSFD